MRAAIFREMSKPLAIETLADPTPAAHELILKV
jgi:Zn-dependent alcohol dehydrogenase